MDKESQSAVVTVWRPESPRSLRTCSGTLPHCQETVKQEANPLDYQLRSRCRRRISSATAEIAHSSGDQAVPRYKGGHPMAHSTSSIFAVDAAIGIAGRIRPGTRRLRAMKARSASSRVGWIGATGKVGLDRVKRPPV